MTDLPTYSITRSFAAPRAAVWRVWTTPDLLAAWYGPGVETIIHTYDLRAGGLWLNEMKWGEKSDRSRMDFQTVTPQEKLVWHHGSTDENWNLAPSQMMPDWPQQFLTEVTFTDDGNATSVTLTQTPMNASEAEIACFTKMMGGMDKGWGSGFNIIDELLAKA